MAFHAVRNLARLGRGHVTMRWGQLGFGRTSTTSRSQSTPRNLMGFKDGTNNIRAEDHDAMEQHVWLGASDSPAWMHGGTFLVARRIRMLIEVWDRASLQDQEETIGRVKQSGAPLGGRGEFDPVNVARLPVDAHVRLARPASNGGERILRRGYSFTDGMDPDLGELDAGLFFICFQRDPHKQFVAIQRRLALERRAQRVHQAHGQRGVRRPTGRTSGRLRGRRPVPLLRVAPGPARRVAAPLDACPPH